MTPNVIVTKMTPAMKAQIESSDPDPEMGVTVDSLDDDFVIEEDSNGSSWSGKTHDDASTSNGTGASPDTTADPLSRGDITQESLDIARKENLLVTYWRVLMFGVLFAVTISVGFVVFDLVRKSQFDDFNRAFKFDSEKIYEFLGHTIDGRLEAIDALATMIVTSASIRNETWPYTVMPDFPTKASKMRMLSDALAIQQYTFVEEHERVGWEVFAKENEGWVQHTLDIMHEDTTLRLQVDLPEIYDTNHSTSIRYGGPEPIEFGTGPYFPTWHTYPMVPSGTTSAYNWNAILHPDLGPGIRETMENHKVVIGPVLNYRDTKEEARISRVGIWTERLVPPDVDPGEPVIRVLYPILDTADGAITKDEPNSKLVGILASSFFWRQFLENILPNEERGLVAVFKNTCNQSFTYEINGHHAKYLGPSDLHDNKPEWETLGNSLTFSDIGSFTDSLRTTNATYGGLAINEEYCAYTVSIFPSEKMYDKFVTKEPWLYSAIAVTIFVFTTSFLLGYDKLVTIRQRKVMKTAIKSTTIVSSLFPSSIRDRLLNVEESPHMVHKDGRRSMFEPTKAKLRTYLNDGEQNSEQTPTMERPGDSNKPIADLFAATTVLFADIAGFTAWSSTREPTQVFTLLEAVYGAFDEIAAKRGVFKVETIGDSYVAVTGLPDPRKDHAVVMAKFARDCRQRFQEMCSSLESTLGPDTGELGLRVGMHSGPVTAGVLRGQKSRFQLFGDTVNTASRMESTGKTGQIQASQATADLLRRAKKSHWLKARDEMVEAKGKGFMITYWVEPKGAAEISVSGTADITRSTAFSDDIGTSTRLNNRMERLIAWNIDILEQLLKKIVVRRRVIKQKSLSVKWNKTNPKSSAVLDEVQEVIKLPEYDGKYHNADYDSSLVVLSSQIRAQLREYVAAIALMYPENPFHNFQHASHVGMSVAKLLSRIVAPDIDLEGDEELHDHTYGITSDPLTQFACVFSALIHDVDHPGVPNSQLVNEGTDMAVLYKGKSVAEQNSINLAWDLLLQDKFSALRQTICRTQHEAARFRQLVVNAVCATDIIDKDLKAARNKRWEKAFSVHENERTSQQSIVNLQEQINRKATIVIEHLIQASDVAHTMQHWHIYIKWNERLYAEMYKAYTQGRADKDPTESWFQGELGFLDFYVIPLAQKLAECGVFGVSSDEYLNYAIMNRNEWEKKGKDVVAGYENKYKLDANESQSTVSLTQVA